MFNKILSTAVVAMAFVAAAPAFAADPFDGPGWEPAIVGGTSQVSAPNPATACVDVQRGAEYKAADAREASKQKGAGGDRDDSFEHSPDFPG